MADDDNALFRYSVIASLLAPNDQQTLKEQIQQLADRQWLRPDGQLVHIGFGTIEKWLYDYRRFGLEALHSRTRKDQGTHRSISDELAGCIEELLEANPKIKCNVLIGCLKGHRDLQPLPSQSSLYRYIRTLRANLPVPEPQERRSFEAPYANHLWQADIMYGPFLPRRRANGSTRNEQTFLVAIIDDHSRLLCHGQFFFVQNLAAWLCTLRCAIEKRAIPFRLYCDNGQVFLSRQVKRIAAELGMQLLFTPVRDAPAKGKIERWFSTCRQSFLEPLLVTDKPRNLAALNQRFWAWVEAEYNQRVHSSTGQRPIHRYLQAPPPGGFRALGDNAPQLFLCEEQRTVKNDGTFSFHRRRYETSPALVGKKITVRYDLDDDTSLFVRCDQRDYGRATLLDPHANYRRRRRRGDHNEKGDQR